MLTFMQEHYRSWPAVLGSKELGQYSSDLTDDLDYDSKAGALGFNYGSMSSWEGEYTFLIVRWMALKIGRQKKRFRKEEVTPNLLQAPVPYLVYDGDAEWPILVVGSQKEMRKLPKTLRWCAYDHLGMKIDPSRLIKNVLFELEGVDVEAVLNQASKDAGPHHSEPVEKHWAWVDRHNRSIYRQCRKEMGKPLKILRDEILRLDQLWSAR